MLKLGSTDINKAYLGTTEINKIYLGADEVFSGGVVPFDPSQISDLALWLDASDASTITQTGGSVSQWNDKSGNGYHAMQATGANQPITGTRTVNGLNALDFDGTSDLMGLPSALNTIPTADNTVFMVTRYDSTSANFMISAKFSGLNRYYITSRASVFAVEHHTDGAFTTSLPIAGDTNPHVFGMRRSGSSLMAILDGANATAATANNLSIVDLSLGGTSGAFLNGVIGEALIYSRALSNAESNQVGQYLATKWGTVWTNI